LILALWRRLALLSGLARLPCVSLLPSLPLITLLSGLSLLASRPGLALRSRLARQCWRYITTANKQQEHDRD